MGWLDNGPKDTSTPEQRKQWRDNAQEQMDRQADRSSSTDTEPEPGEPAPRHARRRGLFT
jgi:hypothetical protein